VGTLNVANLNLTGNTFTTDANLNFGGNWTDAPAGTQIKYGSYYTGYGVGARTVTSSTSWTNVNINGTNQHGENIGKHSDDVLTFNKISNKSHLEVSIFFPVYLQGGTNGGGIRCQASHDSGSNYHRLSNLDNGPFHGWGAMGYGGNDAESLVYTWSTSDNLTHRNTWKTKTGECRIYFETKSWSAGNTVYLIDYDNSYPKVGKVIIREIIH
tara:strand:+ start:85 stop:720 length:636 start_codon:yes stop_codon:yes gene_type:complete